MKVSTKLFATTGVLLGVGLLLAGMGIWYLRTLSAELNEAVHGTAARIELVNKMKASTWEAAAQMRATTVFAVLKEPSKVEAAAEGTVTALKDLDMEISELRPLLLTDADKQILSKTEQLKSEFSQLAQDYVRTTREGKLDQVGEVVHKVAPLILEMNTVLTGFAREEDSQLKEAAINEDATSAQSTWISTILCCLLIVVGIIAVFVVRGINRTLQMAITELSEGAEQVASAASQVSSSSQSLAQGASEQAASIEETSASSEEINSMSRKNSENSREAADLMIETQKQISEANASLDQSVVAMSEINAQSDKISKIIKTIDEIAFQTNILALNAAVEAARAGEAGMGFAVVADEVRNLAQRAAQAAKDTSALIEESITKSNDGKVKVDQVAAGIHAITEQAAKVKTLVDEVNLGSQEQTRGIEQIGKAITQMEQVTQKAAANAEESASAAEELNAQSETLKDIVERLSAMVGGGDSARGSSSRQRRSAAPTSKTTGSRRAVEPSRGLGALRAAVSPKSKAAESPAYSMHGANQDAFPLDEHFTEF
ncbi:MAG: methyl-accepting chemotaxis protein [Bryobacterales bacterium]|nr:methyl-accepting chemotaxis protein [Bryobacterales bacterium]